MNTQAEITPAERIAAACKYHNFWNDANVHALQCTITGNGTVVNVDGTDYWVLSVKEAKVFNFVTTPDEYCTVNRKRFLVLKN